MSAMAVAAQRFAELGALIDDGLARLPGLSRLVPRWRVVEPGAALDPSSRDPVVMRLSPATGALERELTLPGAKPDDLQAALALNLARWSPFAPEDTLAAIAPDSVERQDDAVRFKLALASRARVTAQIEALRQSGFEGPISVDAAAPEASPGYDLLTGVRARASARTAGEILAGAALAALAMMLAAVFIWQAQPARAQAGPASLATLADQAKRNAPSLITTLDALSEALPDDVVLEAVRFDGAQVTVTGRALDAAALPPLVESTGFFAGARLVGPVTPDPTGVEGFELTAMHAGVF